MITEQEYQDGYDKYQEEQRTMMDEEDILNGILQDMKDLAEESEQAVPVSWFKYRDNKTVYAEFETKKSTVMATRKNGKWVEAW